jgi:hypothetical protein
MTHQSGKQRRKGRDEQAKRAYERKRSLARYGLTLSDRADMEAACKGLCEMCGGPPGKKGLCVDHDHETCRVRGLLCTTCNVRLGVVENTVWRGLAEAYLKKGTT